MNYRVEDKYLCKEIDLQILNNKLLAVLDKDKNIKNNNSYNIRSVYFDDYFNTYYQETEAGIDNRIKIRIRIYDKSDKIIKLEIKEKLNGYTKKNSCIITREICDKLLTGNYLEENECDNLILKQINVLMKTRMLKPRVIVEYDRFVYVNQIGNVRITFDRNIRTSPNIDLFFEKNIFPIPVLETNEHILEVKYDDFLPSYIKNILEEKYLEKTSFSKYNRSVDSLGGI